MENDTLPKQGKKGILPLLGLALLLVSIPIAILLGQKVQKLRSGAAYPSGDCKMNVDVAMLFDTSSSMVDENTNDGVRKLEAAKEAARAFVYGMELTDGENNGQKDGKVDRLGIIVFN